MFMTEKPFIDWLAMSDKAIIKHIAAFIKHHRLEQNKNSNRTCKRGRDKSFNFKFVRTW
jgi:hypothetical protein